MASPLKLASLQTQEPANPYRVMGNASECRSKVGNQVGVKGRGRGRGWGGVGVWIGVGEGAEVG